MPGQNIRVFRKWPGKWPINDFITDFEKEYVLAKSAGCVYSDVLLAFRLLEATKINEMDEKFVLTGIDFPVAKERSNLYEQMKYSLKKFHGRKMVTGEGVSLRYDPALIASVTEVLVAQGWKKPGPGGRRRSNTDPGEGSVVKRNSSKYKGIKNPLGSDGKPITCFKCSSIYHLADKCPKKREVALIATARDNEYEYIMLVDTEEQLCFMVREAGKKGVIDSACSRTVSGSDYINNFISHLPPYEQSLVKNGSPSKTIYQFGGGERRVSIKRLELPIVIGDLKIKITTEVVEADIPLLIGANSLESSKAVLDFGAMQATIFSVTVPLIKVSSGHFCIDLLPSRVDGDPTHDYTNDEVVLHAINIGENLSQKELKKLHHICGHSSSKRLLKLLDKAGKLTKEREKEVLEIEKSCDSCQKNSKRKPRPKFSIPRVERFNEIVTIDLKEFEKRESKRRYICYLIDMHTRFVSAKFIPSKSPSNIVETILEKWIGAGYGVMEGLHTDIGGEMSNIELDDVASKLGISKTTTSSYSPHQNGVNERNHATVDFMMKKMMDCDSSLAPETALFWSINAKTVLKTVMVFRHISLFLPIIPSYLQ